MLGLATKAGKTVSGEESVLKAVRSGKAHLVIISDDASNATTKKFTDKCTYYHVPMIRHGTREKLGDATGRASRVCVAVIDKGFAEGITRCLSIRSDL